MATFAELIRPEQREALRLQGEEPDAFDLESLTDAELRDEIDARTEAIVALTDALDNNEILTHTGRWRAYQERRPSKQEAKLLRDELRRRHATVVTRPQSAPRTPPPEHLARMAEQHATAEKRRTAKAAVLAQRQMVEIATDRMFVRAAYRALGVDGCKAIWDQARALFPEAKTWAEWDRLDADGRAVQAARLAKKRAIEDGVEPDG